MPGYRLDFNFGTFNPPYWIQTTQVFYRIMLIMLINNNIVQCYFIVTYFIIVNNH